MHFRDITYKVQKHGSNITLTASKTLLNSNLSSFFTDVRHKTDAVFLWTIYIKNIEDSNKYIDTIGFVFQKKQWIF
jgi:hypothetical protein